MKRILLILDDKEFKRLENKKEELKILGKVEGWEDFILKCAGVRRIKK